MSSEFDGLVAVVTGGASGIGKAVAQVLHESGARVGVLDVDTEGADPAHLALTADVADRASVTRAINEVVASYGRLDILINNAAIGAVGSLADNDDVEWARVLDVNVTGIARVTTASLPHLRESPSAAVVNVSSIAATVGLQQRALYSASKGAVLSLTRAMAADHIADGIRVNCVSPGTADTPWVERLLRDSQSPVAERRALEARQPHGRLVSVSEIAAAVAYLASPASGSTNGASIAVDGGMNALRLRSES